MDEKTIARFWAKVDKTGQVPSHMPHLGPCWRWLAAKNERGYGVTWDGSRTRLAHHVSWFSHSGHWPPDCLLHACDNPECCNPGHLLEGSRAENLADMRSKGRAAPMPRPDMRGANHNRAKLTSEQALEILERAASGARPGELAREFAVTNSNIAAITTGKSWSCLGERGSGLVKKCKLLKAARSVLTKDLVVYIRSSVKSDHELSLELGINRGTIFCARNGQTWKRVPMP